MGYVLPTQYPANTVTMSTKITHLLPSFQITSHEWETIAKLLEGHTEDFGLKTLYFNDGFVLIEICEESPKGTFYSDTGWEYPDPEVETANIRDLEVDQEQVRKYLSYIDSPKDHFEVDGSYTIKDFVSDSIIELTNLFTSAALKY